MASKIEIGPERLKEAQDRVGLSDEAVARLIHVSTKTWWRWRRAGTVPTVHVPAVAKALRLEFHDEVTEDGETPLETLASVDDRLRSLEELVRESVDLTRESLRLLLESRREAPAAPKPRRRVNG